MTATELVTLIGALTAAIVSILGAVAAFYTAQKSASTHSLVNGISGKLTDAAKAQGHAEGVADVVTGKTGPMVP